MSVRPITWPTFREELLSMYEPPFRARATRDSMRATLALIESLGVTATEDLTVPLIGRLIQSLPPDRSPWTVRGILQRVRTISNFAVNCEYLALSPFQARPVRSWVRLRAPVVRHHHSKEDIRRVLDLMHADIDQREGWSKWRARRLYAMTYLFATTGLRRNEGLFLQCQDLDLDARVVWVRDRRDFRAKTAAAAQPVPLTAAVIPVLRDWLVHRLDRPPGWKLPESVPWLWPNLGGTNAWSQGSRGTKPLNRLEALGLRAGIEGLTFHSLRRSLATHLEGYGLGQALITRCLRHTSETVTRRWYQASDIPNLTRAIESFDF